ncbi:hypothetical protein ACSMFR_05705 [Listeria aquatica]|uniref:hypothetical protein n=1 Tax=Listeria aquatica TaxID=1494960 RepID=UPI003F71D8E3
MGVSGNTEQDDLNLYPFVKLVFFLVSGAMLWITIWLTVTDFFSLTTVPIMYVCSTALTFYGKISESREGKKRRNIAVKYSLCILISLILLWAFMSKIPHSGAYLIIGKILFSLIPFVPSYFSIMDYSEENPLTKKAEQRTKKSLEEDLKKQEREKREKAQKQKGDNRQRIKQKIKKNEGKNRE